LPQTAPSRLPIADSPATIIFNPEIDLILACCGEDRRGELSVRVRQILEHRLDWERLV